MNKDEFAEEMIYLLEKYQSGNLNFWGYIVEKKRVISEYMQEQ